MNIFKNLCIGIGVLCLASCASRTPVAQEMELTQYVHPNIGTVHSRWFFYTPAAVPFGMAKLGASTNGTYGNEQRDGKLLDMMKLIHRLMDFLVCMNFRLEVYC